MATVVQGNPDGDGRRFAIVVSRFNSIITERLLEGCLEALRTHGVAEDAIVVAWVPGAFEIPQAAHRLASSGRFHAVACLGCVVRGETPHFDYVAGEAARGVARVALDTGVPATFGVVTANDMQQAMDRAGGRVGNRGAEAALAALEMADLLTRPPLAGENAGAPAP